MQDENTKAPALAQQAKTTECHYLATRSGHAALRVNSDVPLMEMMREADRLLDGISSLLKQVGHDLQGDFEGSMNGLEIHAIRVLVETAASMQWACVRGLEAEGGEA
ncbi:hypothetical protein [Pseudomonas sp. NBRC 100443]|uniref:hypothetical protein n=1 Tax=Pseudomonas sp. NBRC 100443 TaxID=1113665 RepID=UPI0024A17CBE|nr:hypothetical protein [Pseudomonas sp. NBRC 100443]GLU37149.1 hypothetical protein Pssp01_12420 [Pseudomonas sp. NBRC 100443]